MSEIRPALSVNQLQTDLPKIMDLSLYIFYDTPNDHSNKVNGN